MLSCPNTEKHKEENNWMNKVKLKIKLTAEAYEFKALKNTEKMMMSHMLETQRPLLENMWREKQPPLSTTNRLS